MRTCAIKSCKLRPDNLALKLCGLFLNFLLTGSNISQLPLFTRCVFLILQSLVEVGSRLTSDRSNANPIKSPLTNNNNVSRVASWAVSFENLLEDREGLQAFSVSPWDVYGLSRELFYYIDCNLLISESEHLIN